VEKLTDKQEKYVRALLEGKTQRVAYREAYPSSRKWKDENVDSQASRLFKSHKVNTRYNELRMIQEKEFDEQRLWDKKKAESALIWLVNQAMADIRNDKLRHGNSQAMIGAIKELNTMLGQYPSAEMKKEKHGIEMESMKAQAKIKKDIDTLRADKMKEEIKTLRQANISAEEGEKPLEIIIKTKEDTDQGS